LTSLEPLILEKNPQELIKKISGFFLEEGKKSLSKNLE